MLKHVTHSLFIFREFTCTLKRLNICSREEQVIYFKPFILFHKSLLHFPRKICSKSHIKHVMSPRYVQRFTTKNSLCTMMIYVLALYWILIMRIYINASILYIYNNDLQNKNRFLFYWCVILYRQP